MTNTPTASAASRTPLINASFARNSVLAALDNTISPMVEKTSPTWVTARPNSTTLVITTTVGRHGQCGSGLP